MNRILATAMCEFRIAFRNRWVSIATGMMVLFALVLSAAGSAPTGDIGVDRLSVTVASLTSLAVYLVPLLALLMSFDAVAGEVERGTLPLLLTYPVSRQQILLGKLLAHLAILALAVTLGYGAAALVAVWSEPESINGLGSLWRLIWTSVLLGATFLGAGYALSVLARRPSGAAGLAIALWLGAVVLYDLALLALIVTDGEGPLPPTHCRWRCSPIRPTPSASSTWRQRRPFRPPAASAGPRARSRSGNRQPHCFSGRLPR